MEKNSGKNDQEVKEIKELLTSHIADENNKLFALREHIEDVIERAVSKTVNGKIDKLGNDFREYVKGDLAWKDTANPAINLVNNASRGAKLFVAIMGGLGIIFASFVAIKSFGVSFFGGVGFLRKNKCQ